MNPIGFLDDDPAKAHRWIAGVPVRGTLDDLERVLRRYKVDDVVLSSPAINGSVEARVREVCGESDRRVRRFSMEIQ
jgi:dTDP-glucose 4,6-dehydratase